MRRIEPESESWKKMVLRSMTPPAWLGPDAPESDIVVSTRVRFARNVCGKRFPHVATIEELKSVQELAKGVAADSALDFTLRISEAERDFLLGCRLISPEFQHREPARCLLLDKSRTVSVMVNEEDHFRLQALTAGWSLSNAHSAVSSVVRQFESHMTFMWSPQYGHLTSSPYNAGEGRRLSALFHLIGLAHTKRLPAVLKALSAWRLTARGLFGESSRAVGAFFQVSATTGAIVEFSGACEYLLAEERQARREITRRSLTEKTRSAVEYAVASSDISLADALRVLGWVRWAASAGIDGAPASSRDVDQWVSTMEVHGTQDPKTADRHRAVFLRQRLEPALA
ncbi:MAG: hypothetical protein JST30_13425 [Armatimonadetes bacterium]|nr:hypothetical protein [Armatimonadota bacterium]